MLLESPQLLKECSYMKYLNNTSKKNLCDQIGKTLSK